MTNTSSQTLAVSTCCVLCHCAALSAAKAAVDRRQAQGQGLDRYVELDDYYLPLSACEQMALAHCSGWRSHLECRS